MGERELRWGGTDVSEGPATTAGSDALLGCSALAEGALLLRARSENFPVAPRWLPPGRRDDLLALYGFARLVDQSGDEAPGDRLAGRHHAGRIERGQ